MDLILAILGMLPAIALMIFIYRMDRKEPEPKGMVISLFFIGVGIVLPAGIFEVLIEKPFGFTDENSAGVYHAIVEGFLVAALVEEALKYIFTYIRCWRSPHFNCTFDGIVYAVYVSLGFALVENVLYVVQNGFVTAIARALFSVPGHMCFAVFMGYFMGKARKAGNEGNKKARRTFRILSFVVPFVMHGTYDAVIFIGGLMYILWVLLCIGMFVFSFRLIFKAQKSDEYILAKGKPTLMQPWICGCGRQNVTKYCASCGLPMIPVQQAFDTTQLPPQR